MIYINVVCFIKIFSVHHLFKYVKQMESLALITVITMKQLIDTDKYDEMSYEC